MSQLPLVPGSNGPDPTQNHSNGANGHPQGYPQAYPQGYPSGQPQGVIESFNGTAMPLASSDGRDGGAPSMTGRYPTESSGGFDLHQLLAVGRRRWKLMLAVFVLCIAGSAYSIARSRPIYKTFATLEISQNTGAPDTTGVPGLDSFMGDNAARSMDTQIEILKSADIRAGAKKRLSDAEYQNLRPMSVVDVAQVEKSNLLAIGVTSYDAKSGAAFANAICQEYVATSLKKNSDNSQGAVDYVEKQLGQSLQRLAKAQDDLRKFKQKTGIFSITDESTALSSRLGSAKGTLEQALNDRAGAQAELTELESQLSAIPAGRMVVTGIERNQVATELQGQLRELENRRTAALREYTPKSFFVQALDAQISAIQGSLKGQQAMRPSGWQPDPRLAPLRQTIATAKAQIRATDARIHGLQGQIANAQKAFNLLPNQEFRFAQLTTEAQAQQTVYGLLTDKLQSLKISQQAQRPDGRLLFKAQPNFSPVAPDKRRIWLSGLVLGIIGAIALAMLVDALDNRIYSDEDAQRATNLPVLAQIPFIKKHDEQSLLHTGDRITPLLESNRMLRANISFCATDRPIKSVVVTSSVPSEGKSSTALNLAIAAAVSGENTILIDLDLRRPVQHTMSGLPNSVGFTNVVSGQADIEEALQETAIPGLRIMTSGPTPPNPYKTLNSQSARSTIQKLIAMADFVVIDTPPMLGLADARLIASQADGTLMVISCQETGRREAARAADLLVSTTHDILGTILTKVPQNAGTYGGYYTYQRYGRYFDESQATAEKMEDTPAKGELTQSKK